MSAYPPFRARPCQRFNASGIRVTPDPIGCRTACAAPGCAYLTAGACPWPDWGRLGQAERDTLNEAAKLTEEER